MQKSFKNTIICFSFAIISSLVLVILRIVLMTSGFDFETLFFTSKTNATIIYALLLVAIVLVYFFSKKLKLKSAERRSFFDILADSFALIVFTFILIEKLSMRSDLAAPLERFTGYISTVCAALSIVYYGASAYFSKFFSQGFLRTLNLSPVVYLTSELIYSFASISGKATSYHLFPNVFSILLLAFFILEEGKNKIRYDMRDKFFSLFPIALITSITLSFSAIPDIVLLLTDNMTSDKSGLLITILKIIYLASALKTSISYLKTSKEGI